MEIIILGSGTAIPYKDQSPAGILLSEDNRLLLLDIGPGSIARIGKMGYSYDQLDYLLLTHLHPDHTLDLATLLQVFDSAPNSQRTSPFSIIGCKGTKDFVKRLLYLYPEITPQKYSIHIEEVEHDEKRVFGLKIESALSGHTQNSVSYSLQNSEHKLVFSGDASVNGELVTLSENADALICECSFPSGWISKDHLNADSVGQIADRANVKSLIITHRYPPALCIDIEKQIRRYYQGSLTLASDGYRFHL